MRSDDDLALRARVGRQWRDADVPALGAHVHDRPAAAEVADYARAASRLGLRDGFRFHARQRADGAIAGLRVEQGGVVVGHCQFDVAFADGERQRECDVVQHAHGQVAFVHVERARVVQEDSGAQSADPNAPGERAAGSVDGERAYVDVRLDVAVRSHDGRGPVAKLYAHGHVARDVYRNALTVRHGAGQDGPVVDIRQQQSVARRQRDPGVSVASDNAHIAGGQIDLERAGSHVRGDDVRLLGECGTGDEETGEREAGEARSQLGGVPSRHSTVGGAGPATASACSSARQPTRVLARGD